MKKRILIFVLNVIFISANAQINILTNSLIEKGSNEGLSLFLQNSNSNFIIGSSKWNDEEKGFTLKEVNSSGKIIWSKKYIKQDVKYMSQYDVIQTKNGGYSIVSAVKLSSDKSVIWFMNINSKGDLIIEKTFEAEYSMLDIIQTSDLGYAISGSLKEEETIDRNTDFLLLKLDKKGNQEWKKRYGTLSSYERRSSIIQTSDKGYILSGYSHKNRNSKLLIFKINSKGIIIWNKEISVSAVETISIKQIYNDNFAILARVSNPYGIKLIIVDKEGGLVTDKTFYLDNINPYPTTLIYDKNSGFVILGKTRTKKNDDIFILFADKKGELQNYNLLGVSSQMCYNCDIFALHTNDSNIAVIGGYKKSFLIIVENPENTSYKLAKNGNTDACTTYLSKYPNGKYFSEIRERKCYLEAVNSKTTANANIYIQKYPAGRYISEVKGAKKEIIDNQERARKAKIAKAKRDAKIKANSNIYKWQLGYKVCRQDYRGIVMGTLEQWNGNKTRAQIKIAASPGGLTDEGDKLTKGNTIWINPKNGWHLCLDDEKEYALDHDKSDDFEKYVVKQKTESQNTKKGKFEIGTSVTYRISYSGLIGQFMSDDVVKGIVTNWNGSFTKMEVKITDSDGYEGTINGQNVWNGATIWVSPYGWK